MAGQSDLICLWTLSTAWSANPLPTHFFQNQTHLRLGISPQDSEASTSTNGIERRPYFAALHLPRPHGWEQHFTDYEKDFDHTRWTDLAPMFFAAEGVCMYPPLLEGLSTAEVKALKPDDLWERRESWDRANGSD